MGMTIDNLCKSCINLGCEFQSGIVRTECAFYMPPYIEPDNCGNYVVMQPPKEGLKDFSGKELAIIEEKYISKADYEARLKADMVAMLEDLKQDIIAEAYGIETDCSDYVVNVADIDMVIQQKINLLKENTDGRN